MSEKSSQKTSNIRRVRMSHEKPQGGWCHAWDVDLDIFLKWINNEMPLPSSGVYFPTGNHPLPGSRVACGTCGETRLQPILMKTEEVTVEKGKT